MYGENYSVTEWKGFPRGFLKNMVSLRSRKTGPTPPTNTQEKLFFVTQ